MLKKRIIPCLDIKDGRTVKGVNFVNFRDAGSPIELAKEYSKQKADELVFLDITATIEKRNTFTKLVQEIAREINIPFTVGGGIETLKDVEVLLNSGAEKISINSKAVEKPEIIDTFVKVFGSQCVVLAVDTDLINNEWIVFTHGGHKKTSLKTLEWVKECENRGVGEILLTSMASDGTKNGFSVELIRKVSNQINIPIIASGGAGTSEHFAEVFIKGNADGALAASMFHFNEINISSLKNYLKNKNIPIR